MSTIIKDLGAVSAYAYAVEQGYTGTEQEFAELMASYATVGQTAVDAKDGAVGAKTAAETAASVATTKASEASQSASAAHIDAESASQYASQASAKASEASTNASTASTKATESAQNASQALGYKNDAESAKTASQTARDDALTAKTQAESAQAGAEAARDEVQSSATQIAKNAEDIFSLKEDLTELETELGFAQSAPTIPDGYKLAAYENKAKTRCYKWTGEDLVIRFTVNDLGEQVANEQTYNSTIALSDSIALDLRSSSTPMLDLSYKNELESTVNCTVILRYYNEGLASFKTAYIYIPVGTGEMSVNVVELAQTNGIDLTVYPKLVIRGIGDSAHTSTVTGVFEVSIKGYSGESTSIVDDVDSLKAKTSTLETDVQNLKSRDVYSSSSVMGNPFRFKPMYAHLFLNTVQDADIYVPSQSLYDIQISHRLGFDVIEVNTHLLTDGNYICCHGASGKFGLEFVSADGNSDATIQDTTISSVNLEWIRTNVRYKSKFPKMFVSPPTLEEFLLECRKYGMIPLINYAGIDQVDIANGIMGKDNYIMYGAGTPVRAISNCIINTWANLTTKQQIVDWVTSVGNPCIVGTMHPENFTESEWKDIVDTVHKLGGLMAYSSYLSNTDQLKMVDYGFDLVGSAYAIPDTDTGNLQNLSAPMSFSDFTVTGGTEADGQLTMSANGTVVPANPESAKFLTGMWLDVTFIGSISVAMGRFITHGNCQSTASASKTIRLSTYGMNIVPTFEVKALTEGTVIENIVFKASEF